MISIKNVLTKHTKLNLMCIEELSMGFTKDKKFKLTDVNGTEYFMRQSEKTQTYDKLKHEYELLAYLNEKNFFSPKPLYYFQHAKNVYLITSFIKGSKLSDMMQRLTKNEQYDLGTKAGLLLKSFHELFKIEVPLDSFIQRKMTEYMTPFDQKSCAKEYQILTTYVSENLHLIPSVSSIMEHSDFHLGNLLIDQKVLYMIDFNGSHVGIIHDEFYKLELFDFDISPHYVKGVFDSYLSSIEKVGFFRLHKVFLAISLIQALRWGSKEKPDIYQHEINRARRIIDAYDQFESVFPNWMI